MPWSYRIDKDLKTVFSEGTGVVTDDDILGHRTALLNDPEFDRGYDQLIDFSNVTKFESSLTTVRAQAQSGLFSKASRRAFAAPRDEVYANLRVFHGHSMSDTVMVFRDLDAARRWLEID